MYFGQDVDAMIEARNAREWEELNETPKMDYDSACLDLEYVIDSLKDVCMNLSQAANDVYGFPVEFRIKSLIDDIESVQDDVTSLIARLREEEKTV